MTLTLAAVFAPMAFSEGRTGRLFTEFALAMAGAVLVSGFVALTLTPMMCGRLLQSPETLRAQREARPGLIWAHRLGDGFERGFDRVLAAYDGILRGLLYRKKTIVLVVVLVVSLGVGLFTVIKKELSPFEDRGFFVVPISAPEGSSIEYTARYALRIEQIFEAVPEVDKYFVIAGTPTVERGIAFFRPVPWEARDRTTQQIAAALQPQLLTIPGINAFAVPPPSFGQNIRSRPIQVVVLSSAPIESLAEVTEQLRRELAQNPMLQGVDTDLQLNKPEIRIEIDRERAADLGVQVESIGRTLESLLGGRQVTRFKKAGEQYDVIVQLERRDRDTPQDIRDIYVRGRDGAPVALSSVLKLSEAVSPRELNHFLQQRAVTITAGLAPGVSIGEALSMIENLAREKLPADYQLDFDGQSREYRDSQSTLLFVFVLALLFIYLVLSAQFESFLHPLVILVSVPLALSGALLTIWLTKGSLNVYSQIGLVALIGLIAKNGILIVEFANQLRAQGLAVYEATHRAAVRRFRPIVMTTIATVCGALPLALATGPGAESRREIGWVIVGGMGLGTLLTLFVLPTIYAWVVSRVSSSSIPKPLA
jgi:multidrug efflux pump